ncbi:MAG: FtsQ-type POTRA domain-containing protein [Acidobacteria bacterium]|nr:FtsQ-type POTRA domain-containing protein [Acidobacteriota bacterium]
MARKTEATIQEELYSTADDQAREEIDDARLIDLDVEKESPFLRGQKRVPARRSPLPKKTASRLLHSLLAISIAALGFAFLAGIYQYGQHSWRFRLESSDNMEMAGLSNVTRAQIMEVMGGDIGRNVFFIPLDQRQKQLEQIPWVESASVLRFAPNRLRIEIHERTPVAFARIGSRIMLVDAGGALMELSLKRKYSFPVVVGMNASEPTASRAGRMKIYNQLIRELDSSGARYSEDLSEVDLADSEDVKILTNDPGGEVLIHLGSSNYLERFKIYIAHLREWRQQFLRLESVDLRYERQIIVNPDRRGLEAQTPMSRAAAKAALSAGVKPAALESRLLTKAPVHAAPLKPTALKHAERQLAGKKARLSTPQHWHKPTAPPSHLPSLPASPALGSPRPLLSPKPSPAILKGSESR